MCIIIASEADIICVEQKIMRCSSGSLIMIRIQIFVRVQLVGRILMIQLIKYEKPIDAYNAFDEMNFSEILYMQF